MRKKILLGVLTIGLLGSFMAHKFYLSSTDITYNAKSKNLEIILKCFIDDFDKAMEDYGNQKLYIGTDKESFESDSLIGLYLSKHFFIHQNDRPLNIQFLGFETDQDYIWIYLESERYNIKSTTNITNTVLFELIEEQQNKVRLLVGEQSYSGSCLTHTPSIEFKNN